MEPSRPTLGSLLGQVIDDRYQLTGLLGEGGMGAVYRAQTREGEQVAVKLLHEELEGEPALRERFEREARALFGLEHPNILRVHDFGVHAGKPYLVMELLEGQSLDRLVEDGPLSPGRAFDLFGQALQGLAHAHAEGVLHRDLKTENIFVSRLPDGREVAKLLDFGLVKFVDDDRWGASRKLTVQGSIFGTPAYMPPEQCAGAPTDARSDVYSMGVILFELMTGLWPFMEEDRMAMFQAHLTRPVPGLGASREDGVRFRDELEAILRRAMEKLAANRYASAVEMLERWRRGVGRSACSRMGLPVAPRRRACARSCGRSSSSIRACSTGTHGSRPPRCAVRSCSASLPRSGRGRRVRSASHSCRSQEPRSSMRRARPTRRPRCSAGRSASRPSPGRGARGRGRSARSSCWPRSSRRTRPRRSRPSSSRRGAGRRSATGWPTASVRTRRPAASMASSTDPAATPTVSVAPGSSRSVRRRAKRCRPSCAPLRPSGPRCAVGSWPRCACPTRCTSRWGRHRSAIGVSRRTSPRSIWRRCASNAPACSAAMAVRPGCTTPSARAAYYASEWSNALLRVDARRGGVRRDFARAALPADQDHWFFFGFRRFPGSLALAPRPAADRGSLYAGHWLTGSTVYELSLADGALLRRFEAGNGAISGLDYDPGTRRVWVAGLFGVEVFDADSDRVLARMRTGLGARRPVVDARAGLVYVPTTIEGRLHVFDRRTLAPRGVVAIGYGVRNPHVEAGRLYVGSARAFRAWPSAALRARFAAAGREPDAPSAALSEADGGASVGPVRGGPHGERGRVGGAEHGERR